MTDTRQLELAWLAKLFVGATETGGENRGPLIERFQKAVDNVAGGEPWCMGFVQFLVMAVDTLPRSVALPRNVMVPTESTVGAFNGHPVALKVNAPEVGSIVVWQRVQADGKALWQGHTGIVVDVTAEHLITVEGNTSPEATNAAKERDGQGVWQRKRMLGAIPGFIRLGYSRPWA